MNAKDLNNEGTRLRRNNQVAGLSGISNWGSRTKIGSGLDKWSYIYHESRPDPQSFLYCFPIIGSPFLPDFGVAIEFKFDS